MNTKINLKKIVAISLLIIATSFSLTVFAQKEVIYSSDWGEKLPSFPNHLILKSNVVFVHEDMTMTCDSAVFNTEENLINAYNNIHIYQDTLHLYGDEFIYDADTKIAEIFGDTVTLYDNNTTLQTDYMVMDREAQTVRYTTHAYIWDEENTLESELGTYLIDTKIFEFTKQVKLNSPQVNILSDSLFYESKTDIARFYNKTDITTKDSVKIFTSQGFYNTKTDDATLFKDNLIISDSKHLIADSIYYNTKTENAKAFRNIFIKDSVNQIIAYSHYLEKDKKGEIPYIYLTTDLLLQQIEEQDTLHLHCDSVWIYFDTTMKAENMYAYNHVKFFRQDMQGVSDLLHYDVKDSLVYFLGLPVLWSEENQFTADTISLKTSKTTIKEMYMYPNVIIAQNSDTTTKKYFNQISGKRFRADFSKGKIKFAEIQQQVKTIYYFWEEGKKTKKLTGINIGESSKLNLYFEKGQLKKMTAIDMPKFYLDDEGRIEEKEKTLKGFLWLEEHRPMSKTDIFKHRD
jgi:lipopolysaccharide export system protein LptA